MSVLGIQLVVLWAATCQRADLLAENLTLRQQLAVYQRERPRPKLMRHDRIFWAWLSLLWPEWRSALVIVRPETVVGCHRQGFRFR